MLGRILLTIGSVLFSLVGLELGLRLLRGPEWLLRWPNLVLEYRLDTRASGASWTVPDSRLGFVGRPGFTSAGLNYDRDGFRRAPEDGSTALAEPPILVAGDSYAHGNGVKDAETWPALLQSAMQRRVVNAAFSGYGLDQAVLRAEAAAATVKPAALVLSFIADDLRRSEMKRVWGAEKPWFELKGGLLVLRNVPVPSSPAPRDTLTVAEWLFGASLLVDTVLRHQGWQYEWAVDHERILPRHAGERLACPLMQRLAPLGLPTLIVAEYDPWVWKDADYAREQRRLSALVLKCAADAGIATLDLFETIDAAVKSRGHETIYHGAHPGPAGTQIAADRIAAELKRVPLARP